MDEASQSTVAALPALLRAKQILIVGDDRQVSPELVGRDTARAEELARRHLSEQVVDYRASLREEQSLYDLGKVVFAGGAIMLTEHFRCVAPIIEFSKAQFYNHRLLPLRLPTMSERLDPPLIDILVEDGYRKGKLRRALLEHFRAPFASEGLSATGRRERCESPFEIEMFDLLAGRGFLVDTQVPVGNFRIDLVVEGENDRRLAIECDGDRHHGPDRWSEDMVRQRIVERSGWEVWRCFASRFVRDREGVINELLSVLEDRGIGPIGAGENVVSRHTEQRRWRTPDVRVGDEDQIFEDARELGIEAGAETAPVREKVEEVFSKGTTARNGAAPELDFGAAPAVQNAARDPIGKSTLRPTDTFSSAAGSKKFYRADFTEFSEKLRPELLYDESYSSVMRKLVAHIISLEGPIYGDVLAVRIARAHGKDRTGNIIQNLVLEAVDRRFPRSVEGGRDVFWPEGAQTDLAYPYRAAAEHERSHSDTPFAELASIALPYLRVRLSDEETIQKITESFGLARLRQATRIRFEAALVIAKRSLAKQEEQLRQPDNN